MHDSSDPNVTQIDLFDSERFDDSLSLVFINDDRFPLRHAHEGEHPDLYQVASRSNESVLLQCDLAYQYDQTYGLTRAGAEALPFVTLTRLLERLSIEYSPGEKIGQVVLSLPGLETLLERAVWPQDLPGEEKHDRKEFGNLFHERIDRTSPARLRYYLRYKASLFGFDDLKIDFAPWAQGRFDKEQVTSWANSQLYHLACYHRPGSSIDFERLMPKRSVIVSHRDFDAIPIRQAALSDVNLVILVNGLAADASDQAKMFRRPSHFLVVDSSEYKSHKQIVLLSITQQSVEFFRSIWMPNLDRIAKQSRRIFREVVDATVTGDDKSTPSQVALAEPIHRDSPQYILKPLLTEPDDLRGPFRSSYADQIAEKRRQLKLRQQSKKPPGSSN